MNYIDYFADYHKVLENTGLASNTEKIKEKFVHQGFNVYEYHISKREYDDYLTMARYDDYPRYKQEFKSALSKKQLQHFLSLKLLGIDCPMQNKIIIDVASSNSCFPDIVKKSYDLTVYRQDLAYEEGIHGEKIGGFASSIPMQSESIDYMTLHCSLEHFEGGEDYRFFSEAGRLLKPGGAVCAIPLYMADEYTIVTSPDIWLSKYKAYQEAPVFDKSATIIINNSVCQRQSKFFDVEVLKKELLDKHADCFDIGIYFIVNYKDFPGADPFALLLEKR